MQTTELEQLEHARADIEERLRDADARDLAADAAGDTWGVSLSQWLKSLLQVDALGADTRILGIRLRGLVADADAEESALPSKVAAQTLMYVQQARETVNSLVLQHSLREYELHMKVIHLLAELAELEGAARQVNASPPAQD